MRLVLFTIQKVWFRESIVVVASYLVHYDTLLQNPTDFITKYGSYFIIKCEKILLKNVLGLLLQNATVLLRNATVITNVLFIKKCVGTNYTHH